MENVNEQSLLELEQKSKNKKVILIIVAIVLIVISALTIGLIVGLKIKKKDKNEMYVEFSTLSLESDIKIITANYIPTGRVILIYNRENSTKTFFGIVDDNGEHFTELYSEEIKILNKSNGILSFPFYDNKRILLGDYIFECEESLDNCKKAKLVRLYYPEKINNISTIYLRWSSAIVGPDKNYIAWTTLDTYKGSINFIAKLNYYTTDEESYYKLENEKIISSGLNDMYDNSTKIFTIEPVRGGEVNQFVGGGRAIAEVGTSTFLSGLAHAMRQSLDSDDIYTLCDQPGYEEATISSPDEKLGIAMSTRFSPKSNLAIIGWLPIPNSIFASSKMISIAYIYSVTNVRSTREGSIGPVLMNLDKAKDNRNYLGINLNKDKNWVMKSPLSWHFSSQKIMWSEISKEPATKGKVRVRIGHIKNYQPSPAVANSTVPENITYAKDLSYLDQEICNDIDGVINGKSGNITVLSSLSKTELHYNNFTNDNLTFYNGYIIYNSNVNNNIVYQCFINATGNNSGNCKYQLTFNVNNNLNVDLVFGKDDKGNEYTYGSSTYKGKNIDVNIYKNGNSL